MLDVESLPARAMTTSTHVFAPAAAWEYLAAVGRTAMYRPAASCCRARIAMGCHGRAPCSPKCALKVRIRAIRENIPPLFETIASVGLGMWWCRMLDIYTHVYSSTTAAQVQCSQASRCSGFDSNRQGVSSDAPLQSIFFPCGNAEVLVGKALRNKEVMHRLNT
ncbi:uncharacterized protein B0I36DRAFT_314462 [Microdochium trichocladiopsis]|uniref:Uncharacterized protein n=1 Tax=Microdochium trichocladiopsis TaxID=1682393 RepID=A0A9P8YE26_9PEZI|nr:uncharacterized protein B0I36DRAFT_314462 [Microdochium trichocladiopsis]KAH7037623.1 hypothetical protein B0I36DRAFT_314462 [Microdochium trichocladiopsis]